MNQQLPILKLTSQPTGPGPSFLVDLPREMRNLVYGHLLELPDPIVIQYLPDQSSGLGTLEDDNHTSETVWPHRITSESRAEVQSVLDILGTCRQLYHETIGILYGRNAFIFGCDPKQHISSHGQVVLAAQFLLGSSARFEYLQHVVINLDSHCSWTCSPPHLKPSLLVDITQLVKASWMRNDTDCIFEFEYSDPEFYIHDINFLNLALWNMVDDTVDVRKYARQVISIEAGEGNWFYRHTSDYDQICSVTLGNPAYAKKSGACLKLEFVIKDDGETLERINSAWPPNLVGLPFTIQKKAYEGVVISSNGIVVNRDTKNAAGVDAALLSVNKSIRKLAKLLFWTQNAFTYKKTMHPEPGEDCVIEDLKDALC
ncbi:Nn.00g073930.m01.CDS01 [Neocucurbitaria sp. VM-36]